MNGTQCRHPCRYRTVHGLLPMIVSEQSPVTARYLWWPRALTGFGRLLSQQPGLECSPGMTSHDSEFLTLWPIYLWMWVFWVEDKVQTRLIWDSLTLWHGTSLWLSTWPLPGWAPEPSPDRPAATPYGAQGSWSSPVSRKLVGSHPQGLHWHSQ